MGLREDAQYLKDKREEKANLEKAIKRHQLQEANQQIIEKEDAQDAKEKLVDNFFNYKDSVKGMLVKKALNELCTRSIHNITPREKAICKALVNQYVTENGYYEILKKMRFSDSYLLHTIRENVEKYYKDIIKEAKADDPESQTVSNQSIEEFWKNIDKASSVDDITNMIHIRVSNAEEEFVNKNQEIKHGVNDVLKQTAERVNNAKMSTEDEETADAIEESESRIAKQKIYEIQHGGKRNVFARMVKALSESVMKDGRPNNEYKNVNGSLNVDKVVESVRCMYTLLETVSSIKLDNIDKKYIEDTIASIK